jgi:hypothetical protein
MLEKIKHILAKKSSNAELYEKRGQLSDAYQEYLRVGNIAKAGGILERTGKWNDAASLFIQNNEIDLARRAIEKCFKSGKSWETYQLKEKNSITIESWLKKNNQTRRFVRYVQDVETFTPAGTPLIIALAGRLKKAEEYKNAAELYKRGFYLVNEGKSSQAIKNEIWLKYATECYAKTKMYILAAECLKSLMLTEVQIGTDLSKDYRYNPYRNYTYHLQTAKDLNFLKEFIDSLEDFDPFNIAYDLIKINETELSLKLFFTYYGRIAKKYLSEEEIEIRNEKVSYCLNQYVIYYRNKKEYIKASEIALINSQKKIAVELYKLAEQEKNGNEEKQLIYKSEKVKNIIKCPHCAEEVKPEWEICPKCESSLSLNICECGEQIKPHWKICPSCRRKLG